MLSTSDRLAVMRTELANERTLLAYVRTSLAIAASAFALVQLFALRALIALGWALVPVAALVFALGAMRFRRVRRALEAAAAERPTTP